MLSFKHQHNQKEEFLDARERDDLRMRQALKDLNTETREWDGLNKKCKCQLSASELVFTL